MERPPEDYAAGNDPQKETCREIIDKQVHDIAAGDYVIDIGCGTGETSSYMQEKFNCNLVVIDKNLAMVNYVKQKYPTMVAEHMDIQDQHLKESLSKEVFSLATSFWVFDWVCDMDTILDNINYLLKPGGRTLLFFPVHYHPCRYHGAIMRKILGSSRWKKWINMEILENLRVPWIMSGIKPSAIKGVSWFTQRDEFKKMVLRHGFELIHYEIITNEFPMRREVLKGYHLALDLVPEEMREDLLDDMVFVIEMESMADGHACQAKEVHECVMLVAKKAEMTKIII